LIESGIWAGDEVSSEPWLDPKKGMVSFMLDLMVAEGKLTGSWSEEKRQRNYYLPE
jgi:DNA-binding PadR family transcriptional regulator